jgi:hypothetical protein
MPGHHRVGKERLQCALNRVEPAASGIEFSNHAGNGKLPEKR